MGNKDTRVIHVPLDSVHFQTRIRFNVKDSRPCVAKTRTKSHTLSESERRPVFHIDLTAMNSNRFRKGEFTVFNRKRLTVPLMLMPRLYRTLTAFHIDDERLFIGKIRPFVADSLGLDFLLNLFSGILSSSLFSTFFRLLTRLALCRFRHADFKRPEFIGTQGLIPHSLVRKADRATRNSPELLVLERTRCA